jgi:predicted RNase H-like HicB family nuclease
MRPQYGFDVRWSTEDDGFIATCPSFPGLSAFGTTREEALQEAEEVVELYIEEYEEDGVPLPAAAEVQSYSGQLRLRLPRSLHGALALRASEEGVSLNSLLVTLISAGAASSVASQRHDERLDHLAQRVEELSDCIDQQAALHSHTLGLVEQVARVRLSSPSQELTAAFEDEYQDPVVRRAYGFPSRSLDY